MNFINIIVWLSTGAVIGWYASRMVEPEPRSSKVKVRSRDRDDR